jgi:RNA polymerase sigma factor (sigma-70 family)
MPLPDDTTAPGGAFPPTRHSVLRAVRSDDEVSRGRAWDALVESYWRPVYKYIRLRFRVPSEDAEDLTQSFFARALEKDFFAGFDPERGRFRTFLRTCLDRHVGHARRASRRKKRGGGVVCLSLDFAGAEGELGPEPARTEAAYEEFFQREWLRGVFQAAVAQLAVRAQAAGRGVAFALFQRYDIEGPDADARPTYAELAVEHGLPVTQVTNHLAWARRELRRVLLETLAASTASRAEYEAAVRDLLGDHA